MGECNLCKFFQGINSGEAAEDKAILNSRNKTVVFVGAQPLELYRLSVSKHWLSWSFKNSLLLNCVALALRFEQLIREFPDHSQLHWQQLTQHVCE